MDHFGQTQEEAFRIAYLIAGFIRGTLTSGEQEELDTWVGASDANMLLFEELTDERHIEKTLAWYQQAQTEQALKQTKAKIGIRKNNRNLLGLLLPAAALLLLAAGIYILSRPEPDRVTENRSARKEEVKPGTSRAVLTLGDGQVIILSNTGRKLLAAEGGTRIHSTADGQIVYQPEPSPMEAVRYNTLQTPKGAQFKVLLPDGSAVWLNAGSSLHYPTFFAGGERKVQLSGEGYFEVVKQAGKPFRVVVGANTIEVLGTQFNINAYESPASLLTTLVEGSVHIQASGKKNKAVVLQKGQQAAVTPDAILTTTPDQATLAAAIAWKRGLFHFQHAPLANVMQQLAQWYDVEVVYDTRASPDQAAKVHLNGTIERSAPLTQVTQLLSRTGKVNLTLEGRTLLVSLPNKLPVPQ